MGLRLLYTWYGDDFTGSTDVLEALALHGVQAVLFTRPPDVKALRSFAACRAIGIAGGSRSQEPGWMSRHLPSAFLSLRRLGAPITHYKVCSTFDSSPRIGNIGRAMEIGRDCFHGKAVPIVVAAPQLGRFVAFGNLFAVEQKAMYRIDRHPSMRLHPVTPMDEADLRLHLARQTSLRIGNVDLLAFLSGEAGKRLRSEENSGAEAVLFDGLDDPMLDETARLLWNRSKRQPSFAVGSSGLTYGLLHEWRKAGILRLRPPTFPGVKRERTLILSGSCSPVTARQIRRAGQQDFAVWLVQKHSDWNRVRHGALRALAEGKSVLLYTALGPQTKDMSYGRSFAVTLGKRLRQLLSESGVRRVLLVGGDTSSHVMNQLDIDALTFTGGLARGVPLCRSHAPGSELDGLEVALKGGQIGPDDFFARVRDGHSI